MTQQEFEATVAKMNELETERDATHQAVLASIAAAKKQNAITRELQAKVETFTAPIASLKSAADAYVAAVNAEKKRLANEEATRVAAENARKEAEAAAAKAKESSELEQAKARIAELEAELKG